MYQLCRLVEFQSLQGRSSPPYTLSTHHSPRHCNNLLHTGVGSQSLRDKRTLLDTFYTLIDQRWRIDLQDKLQGRATARCKSTLLGRLCTNLDCFNCNSPVSTRSASKSPQCSMIQRGMEYTRLLRQNCRTLPGRYSAVSKKEGTRNLLGT